MRVSKSEHLFTFFFVLRNDGPSPCFVKTIEFGKFCYSGVVQVDSFANFCFVYKFEA